MTWAQWLMIGWAVVSQLFLVLQIEHMYRKKSAEGVSFYAYLLYVIGAGIWLAYAVFSTKDIPVAINGALGVLLGTIVVVGTKVY